MPPSNKKEKVALFTSGGPCSGLNVWLDVASRQLLDLGYDVIGIPSGFSGVLHAPEDSFRDFSEHPITKSERITGGTVLGCKRAEYTDQNRDDIILRLTELGFKKVIFSGGDGGLKKHIKIFNKRTDPTIKAAAEAIQTVQIVKTMDCDFPGSEDSIGFHTFTSHAGQAVRDLGADARSTGRVYVTKIFGPKTGMTALAANHAGKADLCLIPEVACDFRTAAEHLAERIMLNRGKHGLYQPHGVVLVSEGIKIGHGDTPLVDYVIHNLMENFDVTTRCLFEKGIMKMTASNDISYTERCRPPIAHDVALATEMAEKAVEALQSGKTRCVTVVRDEKVKIASAAECHKKLGTSLLEQPEFGNVVFRNPRHFGTTNAQMMAAI